VELGIVPQLPFLLACVNKTIALGVVVKYNNGCLDSLSIAELFDLQKPILPVEFGFTSDDYTVPDLMLFRAQYLRFSFPILSEVNIKVLLDLIYTHIGEPATLEVMAGKGWLSYWLKSWGLNIIATDNRSWSKHFDYSSLPIPVEDISAVVAIEKYPVDLVLLSWPYMDSSAYDCLQTMKLGQYLLYIGEDRGGCTANDAFFDYVNSHCEVVDSVGFESFPGLYDHPMLIRKV